VSFRETVSKQPAVVVVIAVVILGVSVSILLRGGRAAGSNEAYFYDLGSGALFIGAGTSLPPMVAPSGGAEAGVRAVVMSCGSCSSDQWRIVYLLRYAERARAEAMTPREDREQQIIDEGTEVANVPKDGGGPQWVPIMSEAGEALTRSYLKMCDGGQARVCSP